MEPEAVERLNRDLRAAAVTMSEEEARFLVDAYYLMQDDRKRSANQVRALGESKEPHEILKWFAAQNTTLERQVAAALDKYSASKPVGQWARSQVGIGPIIAAGLLAHIDIKKAPTASHIWRFAGLDPRQQWGKGEKRPWNANLKTLCWKIGESFVKTCNNSNAFYGPLYATRKLQEIARNERGDFAEQAKTIIEAKKFNKTTEAYKAYSVGKLPDAHIHARAKRYAVKLFLSHYQHVAFRSEFGVDPPQPYVFSHMGHGDFIAPPNYP